MKILHVPFSFYPDPVGGTEIYVESLAHELQHLHLEVVVAAPALQNASYVHDQLAVRRYAISQTVENLREIYGGGDKPSTQGFGRILDEEHPDIVHLHALTRGVSLLHVRAAKQRGIPVVFTYHTPTVSCVRGTLMRWGTEICDGLLDLRTCTCCKLQDLGLNHATSNLLSLLPTPVGQWLGSLGYSGEVWTALQMTDLVRTWHDSLRELMSEADIVVVLCGWVKDILTINNFPQDKMIISRHGLSEVDEFQVTPRADLPPHDGPLRLVYLGRLHPTKGVDILVQALRAMPGAPVTLDIYGIFQGGDENYFQKLLALQEGDGRIRFLPPVAHNQVIPLLQQYHLLAVPSRLLETGPLVILEAFAVGIPVLGSNLGGIAELVQPEINGILVSPETGSSWQQAIQRIVDDPDMLKKLHEGITPPRKMITVAKEMLDIYEQLLRPN